jgi:hypothetical protein
MNAGRRSSSDIDENYIVLKEAGKGKTWQKSPAKTAFSLPKTKGSDLNFAKS